MRLQVILLLLHIVKDQAFFTRSLVQCDDLVDLTRPLPGNLTSSQGKFGNNNKLKGLFTDALLTSTHLNLPLSFNVRLSALWSPHDKRIMVVSSTSVLINT